MQLPVMKPFCILLFFAACLLTSEGASMRIVNGHEARANSRPYMALIILQNSTCETICGGSLIKSNWVVTAAHCQAPTIKVILGAHSSHQGKNENGRQTFDVHRSINHPKYDSETWDNDIQLMKLSRNAVTGKKVSLLSLPKTYEDVEANTVCETAGWGEMEKNKAADALMEVNVSAISRRECSNRGYVSKTDLHKMCTSVGSKGENACRGDSGGPLICDGIFRGIVSYGSDICNKNKGVTVYTRLTKEYVDWINDNTGP